MLDFEASLRQRGEFADALAAADEAIATMSADWDGAPHRDAADCPNDGQRHVCREHVPGIP